MIVAAVIGGFPVFNYYVSIGRSRVSENLTSLSPPVEILASKYSMCSQIIVAKISLIFSLCTKQEAK